VLNTFGDLSVVRNRGEVRHPFAREQNTGQIVHGGAISRLLDPMATFPFESKMVMN
jgi:hypothetical protein